MALPTRASDCRRLVLLTKFIFAGKFSRSLRLEDTLTLPSAIFETYRSTLVSQPLSALWRGHGSAIFLEFGRLSPKVKRDGSAANPQGDYTVIIEWSWRIENEESILCGSWSDEDNWKEIFQTLIGQTVQDISIYGRLPELSISFANGLYVASFMTAEGQPAWGIIDRSPQHQKCRCLGVRDGVIVEEF